MNNEYKAASLPYWISEESLGEVRYAENYA
jgi:hypothetical protein